MTGFFCSKIWNYEIEIDIRAGIAAAILIILLPILYVFNKVHEIKKSESKVYTEEKSERVMMVNIGGESGKSNKDKQIMSKDFIRNFI